MQPTFGRRNTTPVSTAAATNAAFAVRAAQPAPAPRFTPSPPAPVISKHWLDIVLHYLFSPNGRVTRWQYRLGLWLTVPVYYAAVLIAKQAQVDMHTAMQGAINASGAWFALMELTASVLVLCTAFWCGLAATIKRLHDLDRTGWWAPLGWIPILGWIAQAIVCGWMPGTRGPNRFGPQVR